MSKTLPQMIATAETESCNAPEEHLHPACDRERLAHYTMCKNDVAPYAGVDAFFEMKF